MAEREINRISMYDEARVVLGYSVGLRNSFDQEIHILVHCEIKSSDKDRWCCTELVWKKS